MVRFNAPFTLNLHIVHELNTIEYDLVDIGNLDNIFINFVVNRT